MDKNTQTESFFLRPLGRHLLSQNIEDENTTFINKVDEEEIPKISVRN